MQPRDRRSRLIHPRDRPRAAVTAGAVVIPRKGNDVAQRICGQVECEKPHRARGLCSTHYNQLVLGETRRHPKVTAACAICGSTVLRRSDSRYKPTCSTACRTIVQWGERLAPPDEYDWQVDAAKRARKHGCRIVEEFDRTDIFTRDDWTCRACSIRCSSPNPYERTAATVDHVVPLALGGEHSRANAQTLCLSCNSAKQAAPWPSAAA